MSPLEHPLIIKLKEITKCTIRRMNEASAAPAWFAQALTTKPHHRDIDVELCPIRMRTWGERGRPGLVLIHGGAAHSGWWDHIAPLLARTHHVVALDLSGHGDSGHRESYSLMTWAAEVAAAATLAADFPVVLVGHSMGGRIASVAAAEYPELIDGVMLIDSPLLDLQPDEAALAKRRRPTRVYSTRDEATARWVTLPEQRLILPYVREHVARQSVRQVDGGWTWKFDPLMFGSARRLGDRLSTIKCPVALFRCEEGIVTGEMARRVRETLGDRFDIIELPATGHHPMLDQPLLVVAAVRTALTFWARA